MKVQALPVNYMQNIHIPGKTGIVKCPHGSPAGTCPACMGMGGGGGGGSAIKPKPTAKELGLLTWADLLPAWNAMLAAKQRQECDKKFDVLSAIKKHIEQFYIYTAITINNFINSKIMPLMKLFGSQVLAPLTKALNQTMQTINNIYTQLKTQLTQQLTKIAGMLNEKFQQVMEKIKQAVEMVKNAMEIFVSNFKDKEKAVKEFLASFANKLKKKLFRIIEATDNSFENLEDREENEKTYK